MLVGGNGGGILRPRPPRPILGPRRINPALLAGLFGGRQAMPAQNPPQPGQLFPGFEGGPQRVAEPMPLPQHIMQQPPMDPYAMAQAQMQKHGIQGLNLGLPAVPIQQDMAALRQHLLGARMAGLRRAMPKGPRLRTAQPRGPRLRTAQPRY